jgi:hypothetical protein
MAASGRLPSSWVTPAAALSAAGLLRRRRWIPLIVEMGELVRACFRFAIALPAVLALAACGQGARSTADAASAGSSTGSSAGVAPSGGAGAAAPKGSHVVVYEVTGKSHSADITFMDVGNKTKDVAAAALPWHVSITVSGFFPYPSVTALGNDSAAVTCRITVDGKQIAQKSSTNQVALVGCDGVIQ